MTGEWHEHLEQVSGYVKGLKAQSEHEVPCAVLTSGKWLVVFTSPVETFVNGKIVEDDFHIFKIEDYVRQAKTIYYYLNRARLGPVVPEKLRPAQLPDYVNSQNFLAAYHAVLICYQGMGTSLFAPRPQISIYPALVIQRDDGALFTVIESEEPITKRLTKLDDEETRTLGPHIAEVESQAKSLLENCSRAINLKLVAFELSYFPGFRERPPAYQYTLLSLTGQRPVFARRRDGNEWLFVTGGFSHYLLEKPVVQCRFHAWKECHTSGQAAGDTSINSPRVASPRTFFTDADVYHCANQVTLDTRKLRCQLGELDQRTCCAVCIYRSSCWTDDEYGAMPCGR